MDRIQPHIVAIATILAACSEPNEYVAPPPPTVTVAPPEQRDLTEYIEFTGVTEAVAEVEIRARVKGFLKQKVHFEEGDFIEAGALLYTIEPDEYEANVARAQAAVGVADAALELAGARLTRMEQAGEKNAVSEIDVLESRAERSSAVAQVAEGQAELAAMELDLSYTEIRAPMTGRVGRSLVDEGNLVGAGEQTLLTTIVQYDPMYAYFDLSERDVLALMNNKENRKLEGERAGEAPQEARKGSVEAIRKYVMDLGLSDEKGYRHRGNLHFTAQGIDAATGTFLIRGIFPNPDPITLLPGLFCRGRLPIGELADALLVPEVALGADQGGNYVLVVDDENVVEQRPVVTGIRVDGMLVIQSGLDADEQVVVNGILRARPGAKVDPKPKPPEASTSPPTESKAAEETEAPASNG